MQHEADSSTTAQQGVDSDRRRTTRRALLGASIGALAAVGAQAIGRPLATRAANGDLVTVGGIFSATRTTGITTTGGHGLQGMTTAAARAGIYGEHIGTTGSRFGVHGKSPNTGVRGEAAGNGTGVHGTTDTGWGISGEATGGSDTSVGVAGRSLFGIGVLGYSGQSANLPPHTGVHGYASHYNASRGVSGETDIGHGVHGEALDGTGVYGGSSTGEGVHGTSDGSNGTSGKSGSNIASGVYGENTAGGYGVYGRSNTGQGYGVFGESTNGFGVWGNSTSGKAVYGESVSNVGVQGISSGPSVPAVFGRTFGDSTGVMGYSGPGGPPPGSPQKTGVFGYAAQDPSAIGALGQTTTGTGVSGAATSGVGVSASAGAKGFALITQGRVDFSTSGLTVVPAGSASMQISAGSNLETSSRILCTFESNQAGLSIDRITRNAVADTFRVILSGPVAAGKVAKVNWFVIG